ncbi:MAG TPA: hypothetical protein VFG78_11375 [Gemmatimonadota bacterium]|nr:hypothetical protein [Gemmatimonadota bacterium]
MSLSPIARVLFTIRERNVRSLLMGGQACILYGAAEFSRDADLAVFASRDNLENLNDALSSLAAEVVAVPPFEIEYLERGHAVHFRCRHPDLRGVRIDVMTRMRGVDPFPDLWERRTTFPLPEGLDVEAMSLPDLVASKKTQRDKDWPMIRRLVEANYEQFFNEPGEERVRFWLGELRTPELLVECASRFAEAARRLAVERPAVADALSGDEAETARRLEEEQAREMEADRAYWAPLRAELEALRRERRRKSR